MASVIRIYWVLWIKLLSHIDKLICSWMTINLIEHHSLKLISFAENFFQKWWGVCYQSSIHLVAVFCCKWFKTYLMPRKIISWQSYCPLELINSHLRSKLVILRQVFEYWHFDIIIIFTLISSILWNILLLFLISSNHNIERNFLLISSIFFTLLNWF